jgi:hypothetical protein
MNSPTRWLLGICRLYMWYSRSTKDSQSVLLFVADYYPFLDMRSSCQPIIFHFGISCKLMLLHCHLGSWRLFAISRSRFRNELWPVLMPTGHCGGEDGGVPSTVVLKDVCRLKQTNSDKERLSFAYKNRHLSLLTPVPMAPNYRDRKCTFGELVLLLAVKASGCGGRVD